MRISVFPKAYLDAMAVRRTKSVFEWIEQARALPVEGLEMHSGFFWDKSNDGIDKVGAALSSAGFEMPMLCVSPDFANPDADTRSRDFDLEVEMISIAARLGGEGATCRVLSGQAHPDVSVAHGLELASDAILRLIPIAREQGVTLALENHYKAGTWKFPEFAQRREVFLQLLERIPETAYFGVQYDPSNAIVAGEDSADFLECVIDRVVTMQASDRYLAPGASLDALRQADGTIGYSPDLQHGVIGAGLNDYERIFKTLVGAGYDGWISIEDGINGMDEMRASVDFLRAARDKWFGGSMANHVRNHEAALAAQS